ncbi:sulfite exporter TauE/SafE family protein [Leptothermofonsia sichuanensis E412]|uniref:sulfite exporter TauE/SafE family protein n=1 Tax=Leptothermofonsia sichuanensis TaxID=2917832 RepID=UPI001CA649A5|nr:sulfite exporter TauE/SafE family protein [Leptothermofonsia sichuanensis]QZZ20588.1 sulfite exporter TauE/SafE family protein [Leptothermofonsia sichuanensis E412]
MRNLWAFVWGGLVAVLGGLIGLGGAEFRLPVLVSVFHYQTLQAIMINLIVSLVTVTFSFIFRSGIVGLENIAIHWPVIVNILAGSLLGSYGGVHYATRINARALNRVVVLFLIFLSIVLLGHDLIFSLGSLQLPTLLQVSFGFLAGIVIGVFSSMLGVAGGELIIPTVILLFAIDIKLAGSLSLAISIPTILMGLFKYRSQKKLKEMKSQQGFIASMALGSILGAFIGSNLLRYVSSSLLYLILGMILLLSALKLAMHK